MRTKLEAFFIGLICMIPIACIFTQCGHRAENFNRRQTSANKICNNKYLTFGGGVVVCADGSVFKWREGYITPVKGK